MHREILHTFLIFYFWKASIFLHICGDVEQNPGGSENDFFQIFHWNVNSLSAHQFQRLSLIESYNSTKNFHFIAITETALRDSDPDENIFLPGYIPLRNNLPENTTHGGVILYCKEYLAVKHRVDLQKFENFVVAEFSISNKKVFIVVVYRRYSLSQDEVELFFQKLNEVITDINNENPHLILLTGDLNAHNSTWFNGDATDHFGTSTQAIFDKHNLTQLVNQPTYITNNSRTCIDLVVTDQPNLVLNCEIHPSLHPNCHHQINYVKININCPPPPPFPRRVWHYNRANSEAIRGALLQYEWERILGNMTSIDEQVEKFNAVLSNVAKNFIPHDDIIVKPKDPPWITKNLKISYNIYRRKYARFVKNGSPPLEKVQIDELKNRYSNLVSEAKDKYFKSLGNSLSDPRTGQKKYWSILKKLLNKNVTTVIPPIIHGDKFVTDIDDKCNIFNKYFQEQCTTIETNSEVPLEITKTCNFSIEQVKFSEEDILHHLRKLNENKAHGHDELAVRFLKICDNAITKPLYLIFKNCLAKGYFPSTWKMANVLPIHKKNEKNLITNYRPISLLPICGKIFEKVIFDNLHSYIFSNNLLSDKQSGYRKGDSTVKQLLSIIHEIHSAFDTSHEVRAVFLDISRAFDRVWHDGLIFKLKKLGVEGEVINIISSFLSQRQQRVTLNGKNSNWAKIEAGVPQGSILGPILFLLYIDDLISVVDSDIRIFADDTFIFRILDTNSSRDLNKDLEKITNWAFMWKMLFNPDISKQAVEVIFSNKKVPSSPTPLTFNRIPVKRVSQTKHLGMILDSKLSFENHVNAKIAIANKGLGVMKQLRKWVPSKTLQDLYKLYVRPHLDYGDILYDIPESQKQSIFSNNLTNNLMAKIESIQYEAAKIVTGAWHGTSRDKLYSDLGWEPLHQRRTFRKLLLLFEVLKNSSPNYLSETVALYNYNRDSRLYNKGFLRPVFCQSKRYKLSFFPSTISDWNLLDNNTQKSPTTSIFKNKILNKIRPKKRSYFGLSDNNVTRCLSLLRFNLSPLRAHKFDKKFRDTTDPFCLVCGCVENTEHFLLRCNAFTDLRTTLIQKVSHSLQQNFLDLPNKTKINILLYGEKSAKDEINKAVLAEVGFFILKSKRFNKD